MKRIFLIWLVLSLVATGSAQSAKPKSMAEVIDESLSFAAKQYMPLAGSLKDKPAVLPKTADPNSQLITCDSSWWTSGFFPGSLWYLYEDSPNESIKQMAQLFTSRLEDQKFTTNNHDVGFMLYCSFGNGYRLTKQKAYQDVLVQGAKSLVTRFRPAVGCIQSWDANPGNKDSWKCPVIIDNLMNLELLMEVARWTDDESFKKIALSHADVTMKNHFRPDFSAFHVVDYDPETGVVRKKQTAQGFADDSAWSRGQSWALYGYTMMYRESHDQKYLDQASHLADFLINHPNLPADKIPYWDYNVPNIPHAQRDASSGAIMSSALIELSQVVSPGKSRKYLEVAEQQIRSLSSPAYRAELGKNAGFILKHSVGSLPAKSEVDVPLIYADYYYIEGLMRLKKLMGKKAP